MLQVVFRDPLPPSLLPLLPSSLLHSLPPASLPFRNLKLAFLCQVARTEYKGRNDINKEPVSRLEPENATIIRDGDRGFSEREGGRERHKGFEPGRPPTLDLSRSSNGIPGFVIPPPFQYQASRPPSYWDPLAHGLHVHWGEERDEDTDKDRDGDRDRETLTGTERVPSPGLAHPSPLDPFEEEDTISPKRIPYDPFEEEDKMSPKRSRVEFR